MPMYDGGAELDEALGERAAREEGSREVWSALARVAKDPIYVLTEGEANGISVECMVLHGRFAGQVVRALACTPLGASFESRPIREGMRVKLDFVDGVIDGLCLATAGVPGGAENPIPKAMAGVAITEDGETIGNEQLIAPPKGVNVRFYVMGAAFLVRLKGDGSKSKADGTPYVGEFAVECDDGEPAEPGTESRNTAFRVVYDPNLKKMAIKAKLADGTAMELADGVASFTSPSGGNTLQVSDDDVRVLAKTFYVEAGTIVMNATAFGVNVPPGVPFAGTNTAYPTTWIGGNVLLGGVLPPLPINGVAYTVAGPANVISPCVAVASV